MLLTTTIIADDLSVSVFDPPHPSGLCTLEVRVDDVVRFRCRRIATLVAFLLGRPAHSRLQL